ncbi:MAG: transcription-repair coupling factor [Candidatus Cloacimonadaceae bacterium]
MILPLILEDLERQPFAQQILVSLDGERIIQAHHLNQSARALMAAWLWQKLGKDILIVSVDDIVAEDIWDDLQVFIGADNARYLPDYEILPYEERSPHYSIRATRMMCLAQSLQGSPAVYSLSIRALTRLLPKPEQIGKHILSLRPGMEIPPEELSEKLFNMGYENEFQLSKVFQYSRRGGIMDIFSPPAQKPARLEFFGDQIVSIRHFSANTQRSIPGEIDSYTIIPSRELNLQDIDPKHHFARQIQEKGFYEGIESHYGQLLPQLCTFADYFASPERLIIFNNYKYVMDEYEELALQVHTQYQKELESKPAVRVTVPDKVMADERYLRSLVRPGASILFSQSEFALQIPNLPIQTVFEPQPSFGGDLDFLAASLRENTREGRRNILLFDNQSQSQRTHLLLQDYDVIAEHHIGVLHHGFGIGITGPVMWTDHGIFNRYRRKRYTPRFSPGEEIVDYQSLKPGDYVVHQEHGIGVFEGLAIIRLDGQDTECLMLRYANDDKVYLPTYQLQMVSKYIAEEGAKPTLHRIGSARWQNTKRKAARQIELVAADIVRLYAQRAGKQGFAHKADSSWQEELESSFIYEDTPDQSRATKEIKLDMESTVPMERLLCGDVGFGKTEVAIRAAFKAVNSNTQVAVLVPTTLLAEQHWRVFKERFAQYPVRVAMLSRFRDKAHIKQDLEDLRQGLVDIVIGTHRLLSKDVKFKKLGLLIIDEEHRFGVRHKDKLRKLQSNVDTLYMSATPIPRTLNMALAKLKEISLMQTSPKERLPIRTIITARDMEVIRDAIRRETDRGGQVFFIHNRVQTIEHVADELRSAMPGISFAVGHAQMSENSLEDVMQAFIAKEFQVLVSTTIVENGIDIANANTILIDRADTFGLAQLYQMRGRVGRSNRRAYCYLLMPSGSTAEARSRLEALTQYDYLGAGFQVALRDLELRGAGAILGTKQSGIIQAIGFNYYNSLLEKAVTYGSSGQEVSLENDIQQIPGTKVKTEIDLYFPPEYIDNDEQRLGIYRRLSEFGTLDEITQMEDELSDRFGPLPQQAQLLLLFFKMDTIANQAGMATCKVQKNQLVLEWKPERVPDKAVILGFMSKTAQPMSIDSSKGLRLLIDLEETGDYDVQLSQSVEILANLVAAPTNNDAGSDDLPSITE